MFLIGNGRMITRDDKNPFLEDGCVCIEENLIKEIGKTADIKEKYPDAEFIDAKGGVIMPGLINAHNHIYSAFARGMSINGYSPTNFIDILKGLWWKLDLKLNMEDIKYSALATYIDCIKNGVTTIFDHHASFGETGGSLFAISDAARDLSVRSCLCYEVSDRNGTQKMKESVKENAEFIKYTHEDKTDMIKAMMGLHASFTLSDETLDICRENTPDYTGFHVHVAEGIDDVYDSLKKYGKRVVNRLFDKNILGDKTIAVHCVHINGEEMDILSHTDTIVVHNPESNMGNAIGCGAVLEMYKKGLLLGLGTDGYTNDMFESYKVANIIHKHNTHNPAAAWVEIPTMLFENNHKIANRFFEKPLGVLAAGALADVVISDYIPLTPMNASNCNSHIVFGMSGRSIVTTIVNGKVLMKNRKLLNIDEERILAKSRELASGLAVRINS